MCGWIDASEQLPETDGVVFICYRVTNSCGMSPRAVVSIARRVDDDKWEVLMDDICIRDNAIMTRGCACYIYGNTISWCPFPTAEPIPQAEIDEHNERILRAINFSRARTAS